ncbi:MAG: hypothetical protein QOK28_3004 [Actinomycetota bacterium]
MSTSVTAAGRELIAEWRHVESCVAAWVLKLVELDRSGQWAEDGFATCTSWLVAKCDLGWSTAKEKMRVAHELERRPVIRDAFVAGLVPFTKVRELTRLKGLDDERDEKFVVVAQEHPVRVLEARVRNWNYFNGQDDKPSNLDDHYGLRHEHGFGGGLGRLVIEAPDDFISRVVSIADAYNDWLFHNGDPTTLPVDKALKEPCAKCGDDGHAAHRSLSARRADAVFDLLEEVVLMHQSKIDPEASALNVTVAYEDLIAGGGLAATEQGKTLTGEAARRLACDAGIHRIVVNGVSEILDVGRKTRTWNFAQRRVIRARHGFRCAAEGCNRRITQIHHIEWWESGGDTSVDNGVPLCAYHHHLVHEGGWTITYNPHTGVTRMEGPQGQILETEAQLLVAS